MTVVAGLLAVILSILGTFLTLILTLADFCVVPSSNSRVKLRLPKLKFAAGMVNVSFIVILVPVVLPEIAPPNNLLLGVSLPNDEVTVAAPLVVIVHVSLSFKSSSLLASTLLGLTVILVIVPAPPPPPAIVKFATAGGTILPLGPPQSLV